jgi:hypothetical protein
MIDAGDESAKDFGEAFKERLKEVLDTIPDFKMKGDASDIDLKVEELRAKLKDLSEQDIIGSKKAIESLTIVETDVKHLADMSKDIKLDFNTKDALAKVAELRLESEKMLGGVGVGGGVAGKKKGITLTGLESLVGTGTGGASAGSGILGNIMNFFGGIKGFFGGGGGGGIIPAAGSAASSGGAGGGGGLSLAGLGGMAAGPAGIGAAIAVASPWIGQLISGAIVGALGSALVGIGIGGAVMTGKLGAAWKSLTSQMSADMKKIGTPFIAPLKEVLRAIGIIAGPLTKVFTTASKILAVPFQKFLDAIVKAFGSPAIAKSIEAVANSFMTILTAITPDIAPDMTLIANSITTLANTVAKNPQAMANVFQYIVDIINFLIASAGDLARIATDVEKWQHGAVGRAIGATTRHTTEAVKGVVDVNNALWDLGTGNIPATGRAAGAAGRALNQATTFRDNTTPGWVQAFSNQSMSHITDNVRIFFVSLAQNIGHWSMVAWEAMLPWIVHTWERGHNLMVAWGHDIAHWFDDVKQWFIQGWNSTYNSTVQWITRTWESGHNLMVGWGHDIAHWFDDVEGWFESGWNWVYEHTVDSITHLINQSEMLFNGWYQNAVNWMHNVENAMSGAWNWIYNNVINTISNLITRAMSLFTGWYHDILNWGKDAKTWLLQTGKDIVAGFQIGIIDAMKNVAKWGYDDIVKPVINFLLSPAGFHIGSPSKKMEPIGKQIITGIIHGMMGEGKNIGTFVGKVFGSWPNAIMSYLSKGLISMGQILKLPAKAISELGGALGFTGVAGKVASGVSSLWHAIVGGGAGGNVSQWAGMVSKALTMLGLPQSLSGQVLYQMQTESGGNVNAINLSDINAKMGDPSRGLMQVIGATFSRYHVPGTSGNIYDPLANIAAAINYAMHTYGRGLMSGGRGMGSGHGYDTGGWLPPGVTLAYNMTGRPERILSPTEMAAAALGGTQYHAHFDGLTLAAIESQVRTAFNMMSMSQGNMYRQGRRS